ncbi:lysophospholipid acyltransferase family protein [Ravibacter arvi]|uniref:Lysophospholipid acyltransferase family protein n=1 Tax=Ravibacter arvi TaxID=2051041 RepID=A0ABP8M1M0_9BACT
MKRVVDYLLSILYMIHFGLTLALFHVYQVIVFTLFGRKGQKVAADHLNFSLTYGLLWTGASIRFEHKTPIPEGRPIIFVANHQSTYDISGISWFLRKYTPIFVSKIELAKGIPSVSYNLRKSNAALINRKDSKQAITEIARLGKHIQENNFSAVIFPEGTRTQSGIMKPFAVGGLATLLKRAPGALIVPVAIQGTGALNPTRGIFPLVSFTKLSWTSLEGIEPAGHTAEELTQMARNAIQQQLDLAIKQS